MLHMHDLGCSFQYIVLHKVYMYAETCTALNNTLHSRKSIMHIHVHRLGHAALRTLMCKGI